MTIWYEINNPEIHGRYKISKDGQILNSERNRTLKLQYRKGGYVSIELRTVGGKKKTCCIHRLLGLTFIAVPERLKGFSTDELEVNHDDGDKHNFRLSNLEWMTKSENQLHAVTTGLAVVKKGSENHLSKYSDKEIHSVCSMLSSKGDAEISKLTSVERNTIANIRRGISWSHISKDYEIKMIKKSKKGTNNTTNKHSEDTIRQVCERILTGDSPTVIAREFGMGRHTVSDIKHGKAWRDIASEYGIENK